MEYYRSLVLCLLVLHGCLVCEGYRGAVASMMWASTYNETLAKYDQMSSRAALAGAQIIVFPESITWDDATRRDALLSSQEVPPLFTVPCEALDASNFTQVYLLSCMAKKNNIVVVSNILARLKCNGTTCPRDGFYIYNTEVALNEEGVLIAVYHKRHDYRPLDRPPLQIVSFNTSFGVEFGMFVCYDMCFLTPTEELYAQGIRNFVFSTFWYNEVPLQTATLSQQGWSRWYGVNLLAANTASARSRSGSGIYSSGEVLALDFNVTASWPSPDALLVADLPDTPPPRTSMEENVQSVVQDSSLPFIASPLPRAAEASRMIHRQVKCSIPTAEDAGSGECAVLPQGSSGTVALNVVLPGVRCAATLNISTTTTVPHVLYASEWRPTDPTDARLDVCSIMRCPKLHDRPDEPSADKSVLRCAAGVYKGELNVSSFELEMSSPTVAIVSPLVGLGYAENVWSSDKIYFSFNNSTKLARLQGKPGFARTVPSDSSEKPLYLATLYGVDSSSPFTSSFSSSSSSSSSSYASRRNRRQHQTSYDTLKRN